jgi:hypothetical protein
MGHTYLFVVGIAVDIVYGLLVVHGWLIISPPQISYNQEKAYANSPLDWAVSTVEAIPKGRKAMIAAIEPASDQPQYFRCTPKMPPTRASTEIRKMGTPINRIIPGTNPGTSAISGVPIKVLTTEKPIMKKKDHSIPKTPVIIFKIPAVVGLFVLSILASFCLNNGWSLT